MKKKMYLVRGQPAESHAEFRDRLFTLCERLAGEDALESVKLVLTEHRPPVLAIIPFKKIKTAVVSVVSELEEPHPSVTATDGFAGSYDVTEALPVSYEKTWADGEPTPGICLLTLFNQRKDIDYDTFIDRWHNGHTPLSLQLHPLWNYNRNVVDRADEGGVENWDGIVEEHFRTREDLLNPFRFFGNVMKIIPNMIAVYRDTKSFLDYGSIEPYLAMEYHFKSRPPG